MSAPRVAASPGELLGFLVRHRPHRGRASRHRRRGRLPRGRHPRRRLDGHLQRGRGHRRGRPLDRLGGLPGAGLAVGEHPRAVHGARPRRGTAASPCRPSTCAPRSSTWPRPVCRAAHGARRRRGHLRAGAQRAGVHLPAARRVHHERPGGLHRGRLAGPRLRPGRPLPVQRQEVRGRPRGRHRDAAQGHR